jgi:predicted enzyme related to lactoylglutathione lyase
MLTTHATDGSPVWIDLSTPDLDGAARFYRGVLGWDLAPGGADVGGYSTFRLGGGTVAGVMPAPEEQVRPGWGVYFRTSDADAAVSAVEEAGGTVVFKPMDVMDRGRMAVLTDAAGAQFSVWQPGTVTGLDVAGVPGGLCWTELYTPDETEALDFYRSVFGWESAAMPMPGGDGSYTMVGPADEGAESLFGGLVPTPTDAAEAGSAPHWLLYFGVDDCDATVSAARERGAGVRVPPTDIEGVGRFAELADPYEAEFAVIRGEAPRG